MDAFAVVMAAIVVSLLMVVAMLEVTRRMLKRHNRVSPARPSEAPLTWLYSPAGPARLHRRLRGTVAVARMVQGRGRLPQLAADLEEQAAALDDHLAVVARLAPADRRHMLRLLHADVRRLEQAAARLSILDAEAHAPVLLPHHGSAIDELARQLDALEAARAELRDLQARAGLAPDPTTPVRAAEPHHHGPTRGTA